MNKNKLPELKDVISAATKISDVAVKTPLLKCEDISQKLSAEIYVKAECLQRVGAFKFRGAYNRLCRLNDEDKKKRCCCLFIW